MARKTVTRPKSKGRARRDITQQRIQTRDTLDRALRELRALGDTFQVAAEASSTFCDETPATIGQMVLERSVMAQHALAWLDEHPESQGGAA